MASLSEFNRVRYAAYRTAIKLRSLQSKLGLDFVTLEILAEAFEQHGLGPNATTPKKDNESTKATATKTNGNEQSMPTTSANLAEDINEDLPYELRLIAVPEIVSCLKMIFEMVAATVAVEANSNSATNESANTSKKFKSSSKDKKDKDRQGKDDKESSVASSSSNSGAASINVPLCVDLCLNWVLALYDA